MHKLLERQLRRATAADGSVDYCRLCELVSAAYDEADGERRLNGRALDVLQDELEAANRRFREEVEARFAVVMDNIGEAVVVFDDQGVIEGFNRAAENAFDYAARDIVGRNIGILMNPADVVRHDKSRHRYVRNGKRDTVGNGHEVTARRQSGEEFPIELAVGEVVGGARRRFVGVIRDISERKQAERELRESEGRFRDLAGSASDWFWETDPDYRLSFVSDRIAGVLGVKPSAIIGNSFFDIGLGDDDAVLAATHRDTIAARHPFRDVAFHVGPAQGRDSRTIRISGIPIFDDGGEFVGYRGIGLDITREAAAEQRARLAQQQLADAIESIVDAIAVYDANDRLVVANSHYQRVFAGVEDYVRPGITFAQILDKLMEIGAFNTEGTAGDAWRQHRLDHHHNATGEPFVIRMADDRWILSREYRTRDGGVVGVRTDITEMKRREAELDTLRRRYQLILDSAGEGILGLDSDGKVTVANRMAGTILHYDPERMIGHCFHTLTQPGAANGPEEVLPENSPVRAAYRLGIPQRVENEIFCGGDGKDLPVDYFVAPIIENDTISGAVVIFHDATFRLQYERTMVNQQRELERLVAERTGELRQEVVIRARTESALRASRERLKAIADSLFEGVLVVDRTGHLIFANASARSQLGWNPATGDIEGHPLDGLVLLRMPDGFADFAHSPWRQIVADGTTFRDDDAVFATGTGVVLSVAYACSPLREDGQVRGAIISFRDIQALKAAEREAFQASRLATVGQLAAGIAHEINTPVQYVGDNLRFIRSSLTKLNAAIDAARQTADPAFEAAAAAVKLPFLMKELPVAVDESLDGVTQIARIVLSMKEFSHPGTTAKTMTDINRSIESTLTVCRNIWKHVAELEKNLDPSLPPVLCLAGELNQVFLNLIVNAAHAIEASGKPLPGRLSVSTARVGDQVEIRVADSGTGIPESIRDRIFDPFFTTKEVGKGTGQGLAICRDVVVTKHGGRIEVDGRAGEGAIFTIRLPIDGDNAQYGSGDA